MRVYPWRSREEWGMVASLIEEGAWQEARGWLAVWAARGGLPGPVEWTRGLLEAEQCWGEGGRLALGSAVTRLVNGVADGLQGAGAVARHIRPLLAARGLPGSLVDLRHQTTHGTLPPLASLRRAFSIAIQWLMDNYWSQSILLDAEWPLDNDDNDANVVDDDDDNPQESGSGIEWLLTQSPQQWQRLIGTVSETEALAMLHHEPSLAASALAFRLRGRGPLTPGGELWKEIHSILKISPKNTRRLLALRPPEPRTQTMTVTSSIATHGHEQEEQAPMPLIVPSIRRHVESSVEATSAAAAESQEGRVSKRSRIERLHLEL